MANVICGWQKVNIRKLEKPIRITNCEVRDFTERIKFKRPSVSRRVANQVFERGYREYLKTIRHESY